MLLSELAMLKYINSQAHPNIIGLIGCCTQGTVNATGQCLPTTLQSTCSPDTISRVTGGTLPVYVLTERASRGSLMGMLDSCRTALANRGVALITTRNHLVELAIQTTKGVCHLAKLQVR
jgi:hypothetical protein